jgi:hypothetical protein
VKGTHIGNVCSSVRILSLQSLETPDSHLRMTPFSLVDVYRFCDIFTRF